MFKPWSRILRTVLATVSLMVAAACSHSPTEPQFRADVAVYSGPGTWNESVRATGCMFRWMGYTVAAINAADINRGGLRYFKMLCMPGGDMYQYSQDISAIGKLSIRAFVAGGGAYMGICGGAYYGASQVIWQGSVLPLEPLGLFSGTARGPDNAIAVYPACSMCQLEIADTGHPIMSGDTSNPWMLYYWGPEFVPSDGNNAGVVLRYVIGHQPAALALDYGQGRVFLIGTHPEIEEDSDRDSVTFADSLDDRGSDWELMRSAVRWCLRNH